MKALLQRVKSASVSVDGELIGEIDAGLLVFLCAEQQDTESVAQRLIEKIVKLRIFSDENGKMNRSVANVQGSLLIVSQFTLIADTSRGNRPSYTKAASPDLARHLYEFVIKQAKSTGLNVASGSFAAHMNVTLVNDGPVTIPISIT